MHLRRLPSLLLVPVVALAALLPHARVQPGAPEREAEHAPSDFFYLQRAMPDGTLPSERIHAAAEQLAAERALGGDALGTSAAQDWTQVGPFNIGGRLNAVVAAPGGTPLYVGAANGGVFRSLDQGLSFTPISDIAALSSVGAMCLNPQNPWTLWVGSGDGNNTLDGYDGNGVYLTRDGGKSWLKRGLEKTSHIASLVVDPADSNRIYVGAMGKAFTTDPERGFYRSLDGGKTWQRTLFLNDSTGVCDIAVNPAHPDTMYCATLTRIRRLTYRRAFGVGCGVWRSVDRGATWTKLTNGLPASGENLGRIALAVAPSQPSRVYASCTSGAISGYVGVGVYLSDDGGDSWARQDLATSHRNAFGGFAWYFGRIVVAPQDPNELYVLGVTLLHSLDAGQTLLDDTNVAHVDQHDLWLDPTDPTRRFLGNDGGFWYRLIGQWIGPASMPISQFYAGAVDPANANRVIGGLQDNGTIKTEAGPAAWTRSLGGDGFQTWISPSTANLLVGEWQYACDKSGLRRSTNNGATWNTTLGWVTSDRFNWNTPIVGSPVNPVTILSASHRVYRSTNAGVNWAPISPDLTTNPGAAVVYGTITTLAISAADSLLYLAGTDDGKVWRSQNAGALWEDISAGLPGRYVTSVVADPLNAQRVFVAHTGFGQDLHDPRVFMSDDRGSTWQSISGNLPDAPVNDLIVDPVLPGTLYAGTDLGVFVTRNLGQTWTALGGAMPVQPVWDLVLHAASRQLYAFTHGRSAWKVDLNTISLSVPRTQSRSDLALSAPAPNPARGAARLELALAAAAQVEVIVFDAAGRRVRTLTRGALAPGRHVLTWDARDERGVRARSGVYFVRASDGSATRTQRVVLAE